MSESEDIGISVRSLILEPQHFARYENFEGHCGKVVGVGSEGHELATTGLDRARLPAWTSVGPFLRSIAALEKLMTEITNSRPRQKVKKRIEKVGLHCVRVGAKAEEFQACIST